MVYRCFRLRVVILAERRRHQAADKKMPALTIAAEADTQIPFIVCERGQEPRVGAFKRFDTPHIADEVFSAVALNGTPLFAW